MSTTNNKKVSSLSQVEIVSNKLEHLPIVTIPTVGTLVAGRSAGLDRVSSSRITAFYTLDADGNATDTEATSVYGPTQWWDGEKWIAT